MLVYQRVCKHHKSIIYIYTMGYINPLFYGPCSIADSLAYRDEPYEVDALEVV